MIIVSCNAIRGIVTTMVLHYRDMFQSQSEINKLKTTRTLNGFLMAIRCVVIFPKISNEYLFSAVSGMDAGKEDTISAIARPLNIHCVVARHQSKTSCIEIVGEQSTLNKCVTWSATDCGESPLLIKHQLGLYRFRSTSAVNTNDLIRVPQKKMVCGKIVKENKKKWCAKLRTVIFFPSLIRYTCNVATTICHRKICNNNMCGDSALSFFLLFRRSFQKE